MGSLDTCPVTPGTYSFFSPAKPKPPPQRAPRTLSSPAGRGAGRRGRNPGGFAPRPPGFTALQPPAPQSCLELAVTQETPSTSGPEAATCAIAPSHNSLVVPLAPRHGVAACPAPAGGGRNPDWHPSCGSWRPCGGLAPPQGAGAPCGGWRPCRGLAPPQGAGAHAGGWRPCRGLAPLQGAGAPAGGWRPCRGLAPPAGGWRPCGGWGGVDHPPHGLTPVATALPPCGLARALSTPPHR